MVESCEIIGRNQYEHATTLIESAKEEITGKVDYRLSYLDMHNVAVSVPVITPPDISVSTFWLFTSLYIPC
jgi:hypothetical protein